MKSEKGCPLDSTQRTAYENHMVGARKQKSSSNYESDMKGEKHHRHEKVQGFAMGGVAKIRHKQSTPKGMPVKCAAKHA